MSDATTFDPDALRKEFADYCTEVEPGIKAHAPKLNQLETLALIGMTLFQAAKELKEERTQQAARIADLEAQLVKANDAWLALSQSQTAPASKDAIRREAFEEAAQRIESMNDSAGDRASYDNREMYDDEVVRMRALSDAAAAIRALSQKKSGE